MSLRASVLALGFLSSLVAVGCGDETVGATDAANRYTVEGGDRFVVSASPERIVLKKSAAGIDFPFTQASLQGKAILIHPVQGKADTGVYARAVKVTSENATYVIESKPLTLAEMGSIAEDDIVRIYIDANRSAPRRDLTGGTLRPATLRPQASVSGVAFTGLDLGSGLDFGSPVFLRPGIAFTHDIEKVSLDSEVLANWSSEDGLDLGFRGGFEWKSKLTVSGRLGGEFFRSPTVEGPPMLVFVPIGWVPVPVYLRASAVVTCSAAITGFADLNLNLSAKARIGGSVRVHPTTDTSASEWVKEGPWPAEGSGDADASLTPTSKIEAAVSCSLPRIELHADVAGIAGPYIAITPTATLDKTGANMSASLAAGVGAGMIGLGSGVEVNLYTWKP